MLKRKLTRRDFTPDPTPVWVKSNGTIAPSPFFLNWWKQVSKQIFGDEEHVIEAAVDLGYLWRYRDPNNGQLQHDPIGFDYDPLLYRASMNIPQDMPLVHQDDSKHDEYQRLWKLLLSEYKGERTGGR